MAISQRAKDLTENIYICYGSDTGWLFGVSPDLRFAVEGIVQSVLDQVEDGDLAPRLLEALEHSTTALSYIAAELEELGEHEDAAMMERQAEENRAAIEAAREG